MYSFYNTCKPKDSWFVTEGYSCSWEPTIYLLDSSSTGFSVSRVMKARGLNSRVLHQRIESSITSSYRRKSKTEIQSLMERIQREYKKGNNLFHHR